MTQRNFVLLCWHLVTERDILRFGGEVFRKRGYKGRYVSCWRALYEPENVISEEGDFRNHSDAIVPESRAELESFLDTLASDDFILMLVPLMPETAWVFQALDARNLPYVSAWLAKTPANFPIRWDSLKDIGQSVRTCARAAIKALRLTRERLRVYRAVGLRYLALRGPKFFLRAGTYSLPFFPFVPKLHRAETIDVGSLELFWVTRSLANGFLTPNNPYAIFLDEAMGHHPDWSIEGGRPQAMEAINADIRRTLDRIERDTGLPVVVALHPKSAYTPEAFRETYVDRQSFKHNTAALIRNADLVIGHASTSLTMAVICDKPIIFLTNQHIRESRDGLYVDYFATWLGDGATEMEAYRDGGGKPFQIPSVDQKKYARYMRLFVAAEGACTESVWDYVIDRFEEHTGQA